MKVNLREAILERIQKIDERVIKVRETFRAPRSQTYPDLREQVDGYCSQCGLPLDQHVSHDPPGWPEPPSHGSDWRRHTRDLHLHYGKALALLSLKNLMDMPLPVKVLRLKCLKEELHGRLHMLGPEEAPPTRWDVINEADARSPCFVFSTTCVGRGFRSCD